MFKKKIRMILLNILEYEDSYEDLETIILKVRKYSQWLSFLFGLFDVIHFCLIYPSLMMCYKLKCKFIDYFLLTLFFFIEVPESLMRKKSKKDENNFGRIKFS